MNLEDKIGRLFLVGLPSTILDEETKQVLDQIKPGSIILFSRNIESKKQIKKYVNDIEKYLGYKPLVTIDQEGGIVTRLLDGFTVAPGAMAVTATNNSKNAYEIGKTLGREMKAIGVDWDLAPVVDVNNNPANPGIGIRSFSDKEDVVIEYASQFIKGLEEEGVISCLKHFPGKGRVAVDAHLDMPELDIDIEEMEKVELKPFKKIKSASWMPSHIWISKIQNKKEPATVAKEILTALVRDKLGFEGCLIADDLSMGGVSKYFSPEESVLYSFEAGMDILSMCHDSEIQKRVKNFLVEKVKENPELEKRVEESFERYERIRLMTKIDKKPSLEEVGTKENYKKMQKITDKSITCIKGQKDIFPLEKVDNVFTVKLSRLVLVEDKKEGVPEISKQISEYYNTDLHIFDPIKSKENIEKYVNLSKNKINIILTENAHLYPEQREMVEKIALNSEKCVLIALRNPYDAYIENVENAFTSYGYTKNQQKSIYKLITGELIPEGILPVNGGLK